MTPLEQIARVAERLGELPCEFAFLGGAVLGVLITDPAAPPARTTKDVDVLVGTPTRKSYTDLEAHLRRLGFRHDTTEGAPICRWRWSGIVIDVMPPAREVLGWKSAWLAEALSTAEPLDPERPRIRFVLAPYYMATKIEAFHGRGGDDFMGSQDMEDLVAVVNGRDSLLEEIRLSPAALRRYLGREIAGFLVESLFLDALDGHLGFEGQGHGRRATVLSRLREIAAQAPLA
jgi:hypothetical protein